MLREFLWTLPISGHYLLAASQLYWIAGMAGGPQCDAWWPHCDCRTACLWHCCTKQVRKAAALVTEKLLLCRYAPVSRCGGVTYARVSEYYDIPRPGKEHQDAGPASGQWASCLVSDQSCSLILDRVGAGPEKLCGRWSRNPFLSISMILTQPTRILLQELLVLLFSSAAAGTSLPLPTDASIPYLQSD